MFFFEIIDTLQFTSVKLILHLSLSLPLSEYNVVLLQNKNWTTGY